VTGRYIHSRSQLYVPMPKINPILLQFFSIVAVTSVLGTGCAHRSPLTSWRDGRVYKARRHAAQRALDHSQDVVAHFRIEEPGNTDREGRTRTISFSGIVLTPRGHLLAPYTIQPDSEDRIEAFVGERRYLARPLRVDEGLGMTVLKVEPSEPLTPLSLDDVRDLAPGQTAYTVVGTDQENDYARFVFETFCQGIIEGRYRQFSLSPLPATSRGAPLYNSYGRLVGLVNQSNAWALSDLLVDLDDLLHRAAGGTDPENEEEGDAWFGAILAPVNPDYARANDLPRSALWILHAFEEGAAAKAGFQHGDLLIELNGEPLRLSGGRVYHYFLQALRPRKGNAFTATVLRDGKRVRGKGVISARPEPDTLRAEDLGVTVSGISEPMVLRFNLFASEGVMVTDVVPGSPAATGRSFGENLLRPRDVIVALGGEPTPDIDAFNAALDHIRRDTPDALLVEFLRGPVTGYEALNLRIGKSEPGETP